MRHAITKGISKVPIITCSTCQKKHHYNNQSKCRPFCSERCKLIDLGAWSQETYRIPVNNSAPDYEESLLNGDESSLMS